MQGEVFRGHGLEHGDLRHWRGLHAPRGRKNPGVSRSKVAWVTGLCRGWSGCRGWVGRPSQGVGLQGWACTLPTLPFPGEPPNIWVPRPQGSLTGVQIEMCSLCDMIYSSVGHSLSIII